MACSVEKLQHSNVPEAMSLHLLKEITNNFSIELGGGKYGSVYKGVQNGVEIAVKMLRFTPGIDDYKQFEKEFENLKRLNHKNIVQLLGYCYEIKREYVDPGSGIFVFADRIYRALSFEYMHKGNLRQYISGEFDGLDWQVRYKIIKGICEGLKYLHVDVDIPIYHLDLKPENILLDKNMVPKLADFGLSRLVSNEQTRSTESPVGTIGYLPPEYIEEKLISKKFDIFSLGVVMIKIMAGHDGYNKKAEMSSQEFIDLVHENWRQRLEKAPGTSTSLVDVNQVKNQVKRCTEIASECVKPDRAERPEIGTIIFWLNETENMTEKMMLYDQPRSNQWRQIEKVSSHSMQLLEFHTANLRSTTSQPLDMSTAASPLQLIRDGYVCMDGNNMPRQSQLSCSTSSKPRAVRSQLQELALQPGCEDEGQPDDAGGKGHEDDGSCSSVSGEGGGENTEKVLSQPTRQQMQLLKQQQELKGLKLPSNLESILPEDEGSESDDDIFDDEFDDDADIDDDFDDYLVTAMAPRRPPTNGADGGDKNGGNVRSTNMGVVPQQTSMIMRPNIRSPADIPGVGPLPGQQVIRRPPNVRSPGMPPPPPPGPIHVPMPPPQQSTARATSTVMARMPPLPPQQARPPSTVQEGTTFPGRGQISNIWPPPPQHVGMNKMWPNMLGADSFSGVERKQAVIPPPQHHFGTLTPNMMDSAGSHRTGHHMSSTPMSHHLPMSTMQAPGFYQYQGGAPGTTEKLQLQAAATTGNVMAQQQNMALIQWQQQQQQQQMTLNGHAQGHGGPRRRSCSCVFSFFCCA